MIFTVYEDKNGNRFNVSDGISSGDFWMTVRTTLNSRGCHRVKSKNLPLRKTKEEAQHDLDIWALEKGLRIVDNMEMNHE
jgi:hypothetical protein